MMPPTFKRRGEKSIARLNVYQVWSAAFKKVKNHAPNKSSIVS